MKRLPGWAVGIVAAVAFWVVSALPWVVGGLGWGVGGFRLPIQNLWGTEISPHALPLVALPFSPYYLAQLLTMTTIGGMAAAFTALLGRQSGPGHRGRSLLPALAGGGIGALLAIGQSWAVVSGGLEESTAATGYVIALVGLCLTGAIVGLASGAVLVAGPSVLRAAAAAVASIALGPWFGVLILRDPMTIGAIGVWLFDHLGWVSGVILGIGLALTGLRPRTRIVGWAVALAIAWIGPAAIAALGYAGASAPGLWSGGLAALVDAGTDVFVAALDPGNRPLGPYGLAIVVGALGALWAVRRTGPDTVPLSA